MAAGLRLGLARKSPGWDAECGETTPPPLIVGETPLSERVVQGFTPEHGTRCVAKRLPPGFTPEGNKEYIALVRLSGVQGVPGLHLFAPEQRMILMEHIEGQCLAGEHLSSEDALHVFSQLKRITEEAHKRRVIHADIKPDNLILRPDGMLFLVDWGSSVFGLKDRESFDGGTPGYLPPAFLLHAPYGPEIDDFGIALTIYELLTGKPFFTRTDSRKAMVQELVHQLGVPKASLLKRARFAGEFFFVDEFFFADEFSFTDQFFFADEFFQDWRLKGKIPEEISSLPKWSDGLSGEWVERLTTLLKQT